MSSRDAAAAKAVVMRKPERNGQARRSEAASGSVAASGQALQLADEIKKSLAQGDLDVLAPEALQSLMAELCRLYSAQADAGAEHPLLGARSGVTATDAMVVASSLLKAVNLAVFELGMWQSWTGR
jgi:hypothetical protein